MNKFIVIMATGIHIVKYLEKILMHTNKKFTGIQNTSLVCILTEQQFLNICELTDLIFNQPEELKNKLNISLFSANRLNSFAKNRLITNLEPTYPEVSLILMDASENSLLVSIK